MPAIVGLEAARALLAGVVEDAMGVVRPVAGGQAQHDEVALLQDAVGCQSLPMFWPTGSVVDHAGELRYFMEP